MHRPKMFQIIKTRGRQRSNGVQSSRSGGDLLKVGRAWSGGLRAAIISTINPFCLRGTFGNFPRALYSFQSSDNPGIDNLSNYYNSCSRNVELEILFCVIGIDVLNDKRFSQNTVIIRNEDAHNFVLIKRDERNIFRRRNGRRHS